MSQPPAKKPQIFVKPLPNLPGICITICPIVNDILHSSLFFSYYLFSFHLCLINNLDHGWNPKKPATSVSTHDPIIFYELFLLLFALRDTKENRLHSGINPDIKKKKSLIFFHNIKLLVKCRSTKKELSKNIKKTRSSGSFKIGGGILFRNFKTFFALFTHI